MANVCGVCGCNETLKHRTICRACRNHDNKLRMRTKDRRSYALKYQYGMTTEEYQLLLYMQNYKCAVCLTHVHDLKRSLDVDHCHSTNKIRGLLCTNCNTALGQLKENTEIMYNLIKYTKEKCHSY